MKTSSPKATTSRKGPSTSDVDYYVSLRLRQRRTMLGLSQVQLADQIGVSSQQVHKYEAGISRITAGCLYVMAGALGVKVDYFFEETLNVEIDRWA